MSKPSPMHGQRYPVGFCSKCGRDVSIRTSDGMVFRHVRPLGRIVCSGSGEPPSHVYQDGEYVRVSRIESLDKPVRKPQVDTSPVTVSEQREATRSATSKVTIPDDTAIVGLVFPVYTEAGVVIGRARIDVGKVTILGPKWASRPA